MMKKIIKPLLIFLLTLEILFVFSTGSVFSSDYQVNEIISVHPGKSESRNFYVNDVFTLGTLSPVEGFIIYSLGFGVPAGDLTIELSTDAEMDFTDRIKFTMIGGGYSLDEGFSTIFQSESTPNIITATVPINSIFGIYYVGILVNRIVGSVDAPVPFTIIFSVSEGKVP